MMRRETFLIIVGMAVVTFLPRFLPMAMLTRWRLPEKMKLGLEYIPVSILSAIVFPLLFFNGEGHAGIYPHSLIAAFPVFIFAWRVKSLWGAVVLGMLIYWGLGFLF
jgi:branched-subunit amino acid transport protein